MNAPKSSDSFKWMHRHSIPPIPKEKEKELIKMAQAGDKAACDILIKANVRFVFTIALKYSKKSGELEDLFSQGILGLRRGIMEHDCAQDVKLISYAVWWIRQYMQNYIYENTGIVRVPMNRIQATFSNAKKSFKTYQKLKSIDPRNHDVDFLLSDEADSATEYLDTYDNLKPVSLDAPIFGDGNPETMLENLSYTPGDEDNTLHDVEVLASFNKLESQLRHFLNSREIEILGHWFGVFGYPAEIGAVYAERLGLSRERVRQLRLQLAKKLYRFTARERDNKMINDKDMYGILSRWAGRSQ